MQSLPRAVVLVLLAEGICCTVCQAKEKHAVEPPVAGRPAHFSGGVGTFHVQSRATPTELQAEDAIRLTVRVTGSGSLQEIARPELRRYPKFNTRFQIENLQDRYLPNDKAREFDYLLRPQNANVKEIPAIPLVFYKPGVIPEYKGYQTTYAPAIPITVRQRAAVLPAQVEGPAAPPVAPDSARYLVEGPQVLRHVNDFSLPGPFALIFLFLASLLPAATWYLIWLYRYPDAARLARQRQSRAARQALRALQRLNSARSEEEAERSAAVLLQYLRQRTDFAVMEATPAEAEAHLENAGVNAGLTQDIARFLKACDAARFAPSVARPSDQRAVEARRLVLALEAEPWPLPAF